MKNLKLSPKEVMQDKESKVLEVLDDLASDFEFCYESEMVPYQLPIDKKWFNSNATEVLKSYSKENAILFAKWLELNSDCNLLPIEYLYELFEKDLNKGTI